MVRTKADRVPGKAVGSKAPSKAVSVKTTPVKKSTAGGKGKSYSGGNPYHPRETPEWQKPITCFLSQPSPGETSAASATVTQENQNESVTDEEEEEEENKTD